MANTNNKKQTAANNVLLAHCKGAYNSKIYKAVSAVVNEHGTLAALPKLQRYFNPEGWARCAPDYLSLAARSIGSTAEILEAHGSALVHTLSQHACPISEGHAVLAMQNKGYTEAEATQAIDYAVAVGLATSEAFWLRLA